MTSILSTSTLRAENYPSYLDTNGYRDYLGGKIQNGYDYRTFNERDRITQEVVNKRRQIESLISMSYRANAVSLQATAEAGFQHKENAFSLNSLIAIQRINRQNVAAAQGEFNYIPYSDGKIVYFKDGLISRVENEIVFDEFGNISRKNSYNYQYNDGRLVVSFEADIKDPLGNVTHIRQYGIAYTPDSVFYATNETNARKNVTEYFLEETDHAGNTRLTHFSGATYDGKFLHSYSQTITDSVYGTVSFSRRDIQYAGGDPERQTSYHEEGIGADGLAYSLDRKNITYNGKGQITGYHEKKTIFQTDGGKTEVTQDAEFTYLANPYQAGSDVDEVAPDFLLSSKISTSTEESDGAKRTEITTTNYDYNGSTLVGASSHTEFDGQEANWYQFTDTAGHILVKDKTDDGSVLYYYIDQNTKEPVFVPENQVTTPNLQSGDKYKGSSETKFEIIQGKPMAKETDSITYYYSKNISDNELLRVETSSVTFTNGLINNTQRVFSSQEHIEIIYTVQDENGNPQKEVRDITTEYEYDGKGNVKPSTGITKQAIKDENGNITDCKYFNKAGNEITDTNDNGSIIDEMQVAIVNEGSSYAITVTSGVGADGKEYNQSEITYFTVINGETHVLWTYRESSTKDKGAEANEN